MVEQICGIPPALFRSVADALTSASGPEKTAAICYAVGWTHHSKGVQVIRTAFDSATIVRQYWPPRRWHTCLAGGRVSIQGSTDIPTLYDILPAISRCRAPAKARTRSAIISISTRTRPGSGDQIPRLLRQSAQSLLWPDRHTGKRFRLRMDAQKLPAIIPIFRSSTKCSTARWKGCSDGTKSRRRRRKMRGSNGRRFRVLKWFVVRDMVEIESAAFWYDSPEIERGELRRRRSRRRCFFFPAAGTPKKKAHSRIRSGF